MPDIKIWELVERHEQHCSSASTFHNATETHDCAALACNGTGTLRHTWAWHMCFASSSFETSPKNDTAIPFSSARRFTVFPYVGFWSRPMSSIL